MLTITTCNLATTVSIVGSFPLIFVALRDSALGLAGARGWVRSSRPDDVGDRRDRLVYAPDGIGCRVAG